MEFKCLPPDVGDPYRADVRRWTAMFNRPVGADTYSPNYARWFGNLCAGLMQAKPPDVTGQPHPDTGIDTLPELVEDATEDAAALGVVYLRPVFNGEVFTVATIAPSRVEAVWSHKRLREAWLWEMWPDPTVPDNPDKRVALVEHWMPEGGVEFVFVAGDWNRQDDKLDVKDRWELESVPDRYVDLPQLEAARDDSNRFGDVDQDWLRLAAFPWQWMQDGAYPAPIFASNEQLLSGLERLWDQEQIDAEMIRNRLAVDETLMRGTPIVGPDGQTKIAGGGFKINDNVITVKGAGGAQGLDQQRLFEVITFPDHLTMRERIERRENTALEVFGINPQSVGRSVAGRSDSAAAKRADQQMTMNTVSTPAARLARALSQALSVVNRLNGGGDLEVAVYAGPRPVALESAQEAQALAVAEAASTETLVRTAHPDWSDEQVTREVALIAGENRRAMPPEEWPGVPDSPADLDTIY